MCNEHCNSVDINKVVGELVITKNEKAQRILKIKDFNSKSLRSTESKTCKLKKINKDNRNQMKSKRGSLMYTKIPRISSPVIPKRTKRWGKAENKIMFNALLAACESKGIPFSDLDMDTSLTNESHYEVLLNLKRKMRWVGTTKQILQRILKSKLLNIFYKT